jgi:hypothetical protein
VLCLSGPAAEEFFMGSPNDGSDQTDMVFALADPSQSCSLAGSSDVTSIRANAEVQDAYLGSQEPD